MTLAQRELNKLLGLRMDQGQGLTGSMILQQIRDMQDTTAPDSLSPENRQASEDAKLVRGLLGR